TPRRMRAWRRAPSRRAAARRDAHRRTAGGARRPGARGCSRRRHSSSVFNIGSIDLLPWNIIELRSKNSRSGTLRLPGTLPARLPALGAGGGGRYPPRTSGGAFARVLAEVGRDKRLAEDAVRS